MNNYATKIGMTNTVYKNSSGLHLDGHFSTAIDTIILCKHLIKNFPKEYKEFFNISSFKFNGTTHINKNLLIQTNQNGYKYCDGIKCGFTTPAGYCLASSAIKENRRLICVVFKCKNSYTRKILSKNLY